MYEQNVLTTLTHGLSFCSVAVNGVDPLFDKPRNAVRYEPHAFNFDEKHNLSDVCSHHFYSILAF